MKFYTHSSCKKITNTHEEVIYSGWVSRKRDLGKLIFIDIRDSEGSIQCVIRESSKYFNEIKDIPIESVVIIKGSLQLKEKNKKITSEKNAQNYEIHISFFKCLNKCEALPFQLNMKPKEDVKYKYRFLDLRRKSEVDKVFFRSKVIRYIREIMYKENAIEIATPILTGGSPEGARDYLVPSRTFKGKYYSLPQAPQQFKQLLMASGIRKYFQIAPCFRDEDSRADRYPGEFYQLDFEMSFCSQEDVIKIFENLIYQLFSLLNFTPPVFSKISYEECMYKYGSDKPDLRNPLYVCERKNGFCYIKHLCKLSDVKCVHNEIQIEEEYIKIPQSIFSNELLNKIGEKMKIIKDIFAFCWVTDFPMYESKKGKTVFAHNPFSLPIDGIHAFKKNPLEIKAYQYDLVCNGSEIASGAVRNYTPEIMYKAFSIVGYSKEKVQSNFSGLLSAFKLGAPPHAGCAIGIDRFIMILQKSNNIRESIAFPLSQKGEDLLMNAPRNI